MKPAADQLATVLQDVAIQAPTIPVINNADVASPNEPDAIRDALVRQLYSPVRWVETIQKMTADGVDRLVECGPGKVLAGLNKRIERKMAAQAVFDPDSLNAGLAEE
jgi:[acyl-carrier-protein] S-malonyltransferase